MNKVLIFLAAGYSSRLGSPKGLYLINSKTWLFYQITKVVLSGITNIIIVAGEHYQHYNIEIQNILQIYNINIKLILNNNIQLGSFYSIQLAIQSCNFNPDLYILTHIDMPMLLPSDFNIIFNKIKNLDYNIYIPTFKSIKGHPLFFTPKIAKQILTISIINEQARLDFFIQNNKHECHYIEINNYFVITNLNTKYEWDNLAKLIINNPKFKYKSMISTIIQYKQQYLHISKNHQNKNFYFLPSIILNKKNINIKNQLCQKLFKNQFNFDYEKKTNFSLIYPFPYKNNLIIFNTTFHFFQINEFNIFNRNYIWLNLTETLENLSYSYTLQNKIKTICAEHEYILNNNIIS